MGIMTSPILPDSWTPDEPSAQDVPELHALLCRHEVAARGGCSAALEGVQSDVAGAGAATRRHLVLRDGSGRIRAWGTVHDRAAGRSLVSAVVDPELPATDADLAASALMVWIEQVCAEVGAQRGLEVTQIDSGAFAEDPRQQRWLAEAGLERVRGWWQMARPVDPREGEPGQLPEPGPGVVIRRVARDPDDGMPVQRDLAAIHAVLEAAFTDHFNYHEETFEEFCSRLREDPGHRWDHWWIAELVDDGEHRPVGALIGAVSPGGEGEPDSSYVEYLGVLRSARGRGVARSLLHAVFADAARRGRPSVGIEVDETSSTGAGALYLSMGFVTKYVTESWHRDLPVPAPARQE
jgi:mycothiol synthase